MMLIFRTDGTITHRGFSARYDTDQPALCGGELDGSVGASGFFTSPGFVAPGTGIAANYSDSLFCEWQLVNAQPANSSVAFTIQSMDIEGPIQATGVCSFDSLDFFAGSGRLPMGQFCGNQTTGTSILNPFAESFIRFKVNF